MTPADVADEDLGLVTQARSGSFEAFEALVAKYERRLYTLGLRITGQDTDAQEIVQETFLSLIEHLQDFRGEAAFRSWLLRIATNHALKLLRRRKLSAAVPLEVESRDSDEYSALPHPEFIAQWKDDPAALAEHQETAQLLEKALAGLEEKYRLVFWLRDVEGLSTEETAQVLEIGESNVKVRLLRARLMLRENLTRTLGDEAQRLTAPALPSEKV